MCLAPGAYRPAKISRPPRVHKPAKISQHKACCWEQFTGQPRYHDIRSTSHIMGCRSAFGIRFGDSQSSNGHLLHVKSCFGHLPEIWAPCILGHLLHGFQHKPAPKLLSSGAMLALKMHRAHVFMGDSQSSTRHAANLEIANAALGMQH